MNISRLLNPTSSSESDHDVFDFEHNSPSPEHKGYHTPSTQSDIHPQVVESRKHAYPELVEHPQDRTTWDHPHYQPQNQHHFPQQLHPHHHPQQLQQQPPSPYSHQISLHRHNIYNHNRHNQLSDYNITSHHSSKDLGRESAPPSNSYSHSHLDVNFNNYALRIKEQPPTPGEEPLDSVRTISPTATRDRPYYPDHGREQEHGSSVGGHKRKYTRRSISSYPDTDDAVAAVDKANSIITSNQSSGVDSNLSEGSKPGLPTPESPNQARRGSNTSSSSTTTSTTNPSSNVRSATVPSSNSSTSTTTAITTATATNSDITPKFERNADGKFRCTWPRCGKEFPLESRLSTHYRIHSGKPPYPCGYPGCTKAFHTSSSLSHHRVVHTDQGLRPYVCRHNRCGATYTQLARLITHQRTTHSVTTPDTVEPPRRSTQRSKGSSSTSNGSNQLSRGNGGAPKTDVNTSTKTNERDQREQRNQRGYDEDESEAAMTMASLRESASLSSRRPPPVSVPSRISEYHPEYHSDYHPEYQSEYQPEYQSEYQPEYQSGHKPLQRHHQQYQSYDRRQ
ncbi:hypothetical protein BX616_004621 [Lobosporangium transversale]|uniref:C2H2-type domain-containing protein n=1 Tax=Lobosporangium transversale TaxID=64571 RepID=A0A1Y2GFS4_9FUNG|nr:hypothetical protein BCR41DRAFT_388210 [Lobosporangium transversale]KAF9918884.1 hypothetical protein BX616_004621 [Lobosporangium transversale]ORZ09681.1 hypothetical protein BCR41DRAFT_388210 [Lobosporangium transversale]|eukprot:XP_021878951.1 hypothetical protein BCR41DRAFT_388210 [Lobosporangium transversale]